VNPAAAARDVCPFLVLLMLSKHGSVDSVTGCGLCYKLCYNTASLAGLLGAHALEDGGATVRLQHVVVLMVTV
jgi:hypothetical protein